jgi:histidinol-phosphate/aromatic aminotransferase/cobyric acid decarboxylase-like protein
VVVYLCNPNNPTGTVTPAREIDAWIAEAPESVLFLVDEAYHEYAEDPAYGSALHWIGEKRNVIVVRTFSKIYGMAGSAWATASPTPIPWLASAPSPSPTTPTSWQRRPPRPPCGTRPSWPGASR